jgi:hypothetical protein
MRLLADQNPDPPIIEALRDAGHDVRAVRATNPSALDHPRCFFRRADEVDE